MFGNIQNPFRSGGIAGPGTFQGSQDGSGLIWLLNSLFKFVIVLAGLYTFFNLIMAGYGFISAGGEPKNITKAWEKIWQSLIGLLVVAGSVLIAMLFGQLIFGNADALIRPQLFTP